MSSGQTGCPDCTISLPALPLDTIFMEQAPDGELFAAYDEDISFRLPITTNPVHEVDPETPAGIDINSITITSVENLPFGLSWEANQLEFNIAGGETDGCVKLCGTPEEFGLFEVEVVLSAQILFLNQTTSFSFFINILPNTSSTIGFSVNNTAGCSQVVAAFTNNVPSEGLDGFTYLWDFGNGFSSSLEEPDTVIYDTPGTYDINYMAIIDTAAYFLDEVRILSTDCSDFLGRPDVYLEIADEAGTIVYTSEIKSNADFPTTFYTHVNIGLGNYSMKVIDDDSGINGGDDLCGQISFQQSDNGLFDVSGLSLFIDISHRIDTVQSSETIHVFDLPMQVPITGSAETLDCEGEVATLSTASTDHIQWQLNGAMIVGETGTDIEVSEPGIYSCIYTSEDGCSSISPDYDLAPTPFDVVVDYLQIGNYLVLADPAQIEGNDYELQWYLNGNAIEGATEVGYCIQVSGTYSLQVTNTTSHCSVGKDISAFYDELDANCITEVNQTTLLEIKAYPNPVSDELFIQLPDNSGAPIAYEIYNQLGRLMKIGHLLDNKINVGNLTPGVYFLKINVDGQVGHLKLVKS